MPTATISPSKFVRSLTDPGLVVDGYPTPVSLSRYLCSNVGDGGNEKAKVLQNALPGLVSGTPDAGVIASLQKTGEYYQLFSGQGKPAHFQTVMAIIWRNKDKVQAAPPFSKYFAPGVNNTLQAMVDDDLFGMDCIGFFGRYLEAAGVYPNYRGAYPRRWLDTFLPVQRPYDMDVGCALIWLQCQHIAIIDSFEESNWQGNPSSAVINICQSSNGAAHGPQVNRKVKLLRRNQPTEALDVAKYNQAIKRYDPNDPSKVIGEVSEAEKAGLRESLKSSVVTGYRGGIFFDIVQGNPVPPVAGPVYVCRMPNLTLAWLME